MSESLKRWTELAHSDFELGEDGYAKAKVAVADRAVDLMLWNAEEFGEDFRPVFLPLLELWGERSKEIARLTGSHIQIFLKGRVVIPEELHLWGIGVESWDSGAGCTYYYNLAGEFDDPAYELDQFDHRSVVELAVPIKEGLPVWDADQIEISTTNDFD